MRLDRFSFLLVVAVVLAVVRAAIALLLPTAGVWEPAGRPTAAVNALLVDGSRLLAAGQDGLFESPDAGANWAAILELRGHAITALAVASGDLFAAGTGSVWKGSGGIWTALAAPAGGAVKHLVVVGSRLLVATDVGLFAAPLDDLATWERLWPEAGQPEAVVNSVVALGDRLLVGTEDGVVEIGLASADQRKLGPPGARVLDVAIASGMAFIAIGGPNGGIARAPVGTDSWHRSRIDSDYVVSVLPDPRDSRRLYAALGGQATDRLVAGVARSEDGGQTWVPIRNRLQNSYVLSIALDPDEGILYAGILGGGVYLYREPSPLASTAETAAPYLEWADALVLVLAAIVLLRRALRRAA